MDSKVPSEPFRNRGEVDWLTATTGLADYYARRGELAEALETQLAIVQELPMVAAPYTAAANLLMGLDRPGEAERYYRAALARDPGAGYAMGMLGAIELSRGNRTEAVRLLEQARRLVPTNTQVLYNLSGAYALTDRYGEARAAAEEVLRLDPAHVSARLLLESLPPPAALPRPAQSRP